MAWESDQPEGLARESTADLGQPAEQAGAPVEPAEPADFNGRYGALVKAVFTKIVDDARASGEDVDAQARIYASLGKPDFTLAYLVAGTLSESEKRDLLAASYERRADYTEEKAREFDRRFHRPFPLLFSEATRDRLVAKQIRAGRRIHPNDAKHVPLV